MRPIAMATSRNPMHLREVFIRVALLSVIAVTTSAVTGKGPWEPGPLLPGIGPKISCPTKKCRCEARPFSGLVDLHCPPAATNRVPELAENQLTFEWVYLIGSRIRRIDRKSFNNIRARRLSLDGSHLEGKAAIAAKAFSHLRDQLKELVLAGSQLPEVPCRALRLPLLEKLDLSRNDLRGLRRFCLRGLPALVTLTLHHNAISIVKHGAFRGLQRLHGLDLSHNQMLVIGRGMLRGATGLRKLDLSNNRITTVESAAFRAVRQLEELTLVNNKLQTLGANGFQGLSQLRTLDLTGNHIVVVEPRALQRTRRLRHLSLDFVGIRAADNATFRGLRALQTLDLHEVGQSVLPAGLFGDSARLRRLSFTKYSSGFRGLSGDVFSRHLPTDRLQVEVSPLYDCTCQLAWIRHLTRQGARIVAQCFDVARLTCTRYSAR